MSIGIGSGIQRKRKKSWKRYWAQHKSLEYSSRSGLDLLETGSGDNLNAKILPSVGLFNSTNYLTQTVTNFEIGDSSGYVEVSWYHDGVNNIKTLFATGSTGTSQRYLRIYTSNNILYFAIQNNITNVFFNRLFLTGGTSTGWHTVRFTSSGGAYSVIYDGTPGALTVSNGANDGKWLDLVVSRNNVSIGSYTDSGGTTTSATDFYIRYVDYNNKHKWYTHGQGNKVFDLIGTTHWTWTGTAHTAFNLSASTLLLDSGYSLWKSYGLVDEYVPYKAGNPYDVSAFLVGYNKVSDHAGSATTYNLAPSLLGFNETSSADTKLAIFDRSDATRQTAASRSSAYYAATSLATKSRYHSSEIANPTIYHAFFNDGYRGLIYPAITSTTYANNYYPVSITALYTLDKDTKGSNQYKSMEFCGTSVFAATPVVYDAQGYVLTLLTDIAHFGALTTATPEINFAAMQRAVDYPYNTALTFGTGTYRTSQPIYLKSYKTYTINSTIKIKDATIVNLTTNYVAGEDHIHVTDTSAFNIGEWVGMRDSDSTFDYELWWGWNTWIVNIDRVNNILYFNAAEGAASIWNYAVAKGAWVGHAQSVFIAENKTNITLTGTGLIDTNQANQAPINGLLPGSVFEELRSTSGFAGWISDNITITNLHFINGLRHNICISGTGATAAVRCDGITIQNVTSTFAHNKNCNIRYCDTVLIEDYIGNDAIWEDGLMFYVGNTNCTVNRIECLRNGRHGLSWNGGSGGTGLVADDIETDDNFYAGVSITAAGATLTDLTMGDRLLISNQYDNANTISITNVAITGFAPDEGLYSDSIVSLLGAITDVAINELSITNCTGIGILSTNQFTPTAPPVNVDITGGGFYNHTGTKASLFAGSDIVITDFDNYP